MEQVEKRELLDQQIVVQVTKSQKTLVGRLYRAYGLNSEAALIRMALMQGKSLDQLREEARLDPI